MIKGPFLKLPQLNVPSIFREKEGEEKKNKKTKRRWKRRKRRRKEGGEKMGERGRGRGGKNVGFCGIENEGFC